MRAVLPASDQCLVEEIDGEIVGGIQQGVMVLLGVAKGDNESDTAYMVETIRSLRMFADEIKGKMNRSLTDVGGAVLLVSQFTLLGRTDQRASSGFRWSCSSRPGRAASMNRSRVSCGHAGCRLRRVCLLRTCKWL